MKSLRHWIAIDVEALESLDVYVSRSLNEATVTIYERTKDARLDIGYAVRQLRYVRRDRQNLQVAATGSACIQAPNEPVRYRRVVVRQNYPSMAIVTLKASAINVFSTLVCKARNRELEVRKRHCASSTQHIRPLKR